MDRPLPFASFISSRSTGRGKLPTWVVRIPFVLRFMNPPFLPHLYLLAPIENSHDSAKSSKHTFKGDRPVGLYFCHFPVLHSSSCAIFSRAMIELLFVRQTATQQTGLSHAFHTGGERVGRATPAELVHIAEEARVGPKGCKNVEQ